MCLFDSIVFRDHFCSQMKKGQGSSYQEVIYCAVQLLVVVGFDLLIFSEFLRLVFTSDGSRSRREPYALVKTAWHKQKQKKKETFPFSSASVARENQPLVSTTFRIYTLWYQVVFLVDIPKWIKSSVWIISTWSDKCRSLINKKLKQDLYSIEKPFNLTACLERSLNF